jgi:hypothetical protein
VIGFILLATAVGKLVDVRGFAAVLESYRALPPASLGAFAVAIPAAELLLALWLFSGRNTLGAAVSSAAMHAAYATWSAAALGRGLVIPNCGCFGVFLARPLTWETVGEDLAMVALSLLLARLSTPVAEAA